jgi:hypothetical protein
MSEDRFDTLAGGEQQEDELMARGAQMGGDTLAGGEEAGTDLLAGGEQKGGDTLAGGGQRGPDLLAPVPPNPGEARAAGDRVDHMHAASDPHQTGGESDGFSRNIVLSPDAGCVTRARGRRA